MPGQHTFWVRNKQGRSPTQDKGAQDCTYRDAHAYVGYIQAHPQEPGLARRGASLHCAGVHDAGGSRAATGPGVLEGHPQAQPQQLSHDD